MIAVCTIHRVCKTPPGVWTRTLYEAVAAARRQGNDEITLTESECDTCLTLARLSLEHLLAIQEAIHYLRRGQRYRVLPVGG
jgi:hypothetical protein